MRNYISHNSDQWYQRDVARHLSYESFGKAQVSEAEITPEARPVQLTEEGENPVDESTVAQ